jgi:hypothetical protein
MYQKTDFQNLQKILHFVSDVLTLCQMRKLEIEIKHEYGMLGQ